MTKKVKFHKTVDVWTLVKRERCMADVKVSQEILKESIWIIKQRILTWKNVKLPRKISSYDGVI